MGHGATGDQFIDRTHPYAEDLDLFGQGSLFELLSTARTYVGEETLAHWLLTPADHQVVSDRQQAVAELRPKLDLREDLALLGEGVPGGESARGLAAWASGIRWNISPWIRPTALVISVLTVITLILWFAGLGVTPFFSALIIRQVYAYLLRKPVQRVISEVDGPGRNLSLLSAVLRRLETERFTSPRLLNCAPLSMSMACLRQSRSPGSIVWLICSSRAATSCSRHWLQYYSGRFNV